MLTKIVCYKSLYSNEIIQAKNKLEGPKVKKRIRQNKKKEGEVVCKCKTFKVFGGTTQCRNGGCHHDAKDHKHYTEKEFMSLW